MTQASENTYYPTEKVPEDQVLLLVEEPSAKYEDEEPPEPKKCSFFKFVRRLILFSLSTYAIFYLCGFLYEYSPNYNETGEYVSSIYGSGKHSCDPKIRYDVNQTYEFNPKDFPSFSVFLFGNAKFSTVTFEKHDSDKVTIVPEIFVSSISVADKVSIGTKSKDETYGFGVKGPSWFQKHDKCIKANIVVKIPKDLEKLEKIWIRLPYGNINTEALEKLSIQKIHLELGSGDISVKNMVANQIELTSGVGKIELTKSISESVALYSRKGDINASELRASRVKTGTADGNIAIKVKDSVLAYAKNFNGDTKIVVESLAPEAYSHCEGSHFSSGTVNGHSSLFLPASYSGRFRVSTFNGEAQLFSKSERMHLKKDYSKAKVGYMGDDHDSPSYAEAVSFNGSPVLEFY